MYVDAIIDREKERIHIVERRNGCREYKDYPANYVFYYPSENGEFRTLWGERCKRVSTRSSKEFRKEQAAFKGKQLYESDINPIFRCLADNYLGQDAPELHTAFFDIETDFDLIKGYSSPEDPFTKVTAVTLYLNWLDQLITLCLPPKTLKWDDAKAITDTIDNCFLFEHESDLLLTFLDLIEDADILSGWNSEGFDIPYMINRTARILSKDDTRRYCLWNQMPRDRTYEKYGLERQTFDIVGRVHMDYMNLYRKYTYEERHSYALDAIGEYELNERKIPYEGSLDQLYNQDFKKFLDYNRQDVALLDKLDKKLKFLDLANELAHANTVLLQTTMGAVAVTEQAIINEAHQRGMVVPTRKGYSDDNQAAGAYVAYPKVGIHEWIGAIDINSLYPSAIRALNMSVETIIGQLRPVMTDNYIQGKMQGSMVKGQAFKGSSFAEAWEGMFGTLEYQAVMNQEIGTEITVDWEDGSSETYSAAQVYRMVFESNSGWSISANGTIFTLDKQGVVPGLLERWYKERQELQARKKEAKDGKEAAFWDKRQLVKKINLNSLYGAILNPGCRFFDKRIGQSTTLSGRCIVQHMDATVNEVLTGEYDYLGKSVIYGDTDSVYFSAWPVVKDDVAAGRMEWNRDICIQLYDQIAEQVNLSFPDFMERAFHVPAENGKIIKGGRELVASKSLFITKKRYAALIVDLEGKRLDVEGKSGKIKAMGLDLKRSDTPKVVQDFLSRILKQVLEGDTREQVIESIIAFKEEFKARPAWEKGTPKRVNKLTHYGELENKQGRANMPGHVRAAINWNNMLRMHSDNYSMKITDGMKCIVCKLRPNPLGLTSIAYPTDEQRLPQWFKDMPFDATNMEETIITQKVDNLLGVLNWNLSSATNIQNTFESLFS
jgi:DNA polymerase elongation subunit (family B)